jgi:hypothetical protein
MNRSVLIIEDSEVVVELYKGLLAQFNVKIDVATNTDDAVRFMTTFEYDLYIIDDKLKGSGKGTDLIGKGGAHPDKCFILSGTLPEELVKRLTDFYKVPRSHIIIKPPDNVEFIEKVGKYFGGLDGLDKVITEETIPLTFMERFNPTIDFGKMIKHITFTNVIKFGLFLIFFTIFIKTYSTYLGYKSYINYNKALTRYCETRYKHFQPGTRTSFSTYVEQKIDYTNSQVIIRSYPEHIYSVLIIDKAYKGNIVPKLIWIPGPEYVDKYGLRENMDIIDVLARSWSLGKRKIGIEDHYNEQYR